MRNILLGCLLVGTASLATAQQAAAPRVTVTGTEQPRNIQIAPAARGNGSVYAYSTGDVYYTERDKNFKEEDLKSKEVSKEIAVPKGGEIYIENSSRAIVIKTWDQQKVKVTTTVYFDVESKLTDDEWLEKASLSLKTLGNSVKIKSGNTGSNVVFFSYNTKPDGAYTTKPDGATYRSSNEGVYIARGQNISTKSSIKKIVTITVPAGSKLDIESKYADVTVPSGINELNLDITNGNLETDNLNKFILRSKYSNINIGDVKTAEVEINNGRFSAKNIDDLDIESKYSTIEMAAAKKLILRSTNDEYEIEEAGEVRGRKTYGNLRITKLNGSLEVEGTNADVKIRKTGPSLSLIKIDDKYADIRIPLRETKNYSVDFAGAYSSVYGNFEKKPVTTIEKDEKPATNSPTVIADNRPVQVRGYSISSWNDSTNPSRFTAKVGDGSGLKVDIKCQNCTVDFK